MSTTSPESAVQGGLTAIAHQERVRSSVIWLAAAFALAAGAAALARSQQPFDHGWWLVAWAHRVRPTPLNRKRPHREVNEMTRNLGSAERLTRAVVVAPAAVMLALFAFGPGSVLGVIALVIAFAMLATSLISWCPIWRALGLNTCRTGGRPTEMRRAANVRTR